MQGKTCLYCTRHILLHQNIPTQLLLCLHHNTIANEISRSDCHHDAFQFVGQLLSVNVVGHSLLKQGNKF